MMKLNQKGFSLIEVIISLAIIAIVALLVSNVVLSGYKARDISRQRLECFALSKAVIDEISSERDVWGYDGLYGWLAGKGYTRIRANYYRGIKTDSNNIKYDIVIEINSVTEFDKLFDIKITTSSDKVDNVSITKRFRRGNA